MVRKFKVGDFVEFDPFDGDTGFPLSGEILDYLPSNGKFRGGFYIACYYVVEEKDLRDVTPPEMVLKKALIQLKQQGGMSNSEIAVQMRMGESRVNRLLEPEQKIVDGTEFKQGDQVLFPDFDNPAIIRKGTVIRYIPADEDPDEHPYGGYYIRSYTRHPISGDFLLVLVYDADALKPA